MNTSVLRQSPVALLAFLAGLFLLGLIAVAAWSSSGTPASGEALTAADLGAAWPFTFPSAEVDCAPPSAVVARDPATGITYSINGAADARAQQEGWQDVQPVWKDNPDAPVGGPKISLDPIISKGLSLCE